MIRTHSSSREHEREAVYHQATAAAEEGTGPLATRIEPLIVALKVARRAREDTQDAAVRALAVRNVAARKLADAIRALWAQARIADRQRPTEGAVLRLFPDHTAAQIAEMSQENQLRETSKILARLVPLAQDDPVRRHLGSLRARCAALQETTEGHGQAVRSVAVARVHEDLAELYLRRMLGANRGWLIQANHGNARAAAQYFRGEKRRRRGKAQGAPTEAPVAQPDSVALQAVG